VTEEAFYFQLTRLKARFSPKSFDNEFARLLASEMKETRDEDFVEIVNLMIGTRPHTKPPLLVDFREARLRREQMKFNQTVQRAAQSLHWPEGSMERSLALNYPGAKTLAEAIEIELHRRQIKRANGDDSL
jgi:hypothetical protein